jgi:hypothetical protein
MPEARAIRTLTRLGSARARSSDASAAVRARRAA